MRESRWITGTDNITHVFHVKSVIREKQEILMETVLAQPQQLQVPFQDVCKNHTKIVASALAMLGHEALKTNHLLLYQDRL